MALPTTTTAAATNLMTFAGCWRRSLTSSSSSSSSSFSSNGRRSKRRCGPTTTFSTSSSSRSEDFAPAARRQEGWVLNRRDALSLATVLSAGSSWSDKRRAASLALETESSSEAVEANDGGDALVPTTQEVETENYFQTTQEIPKNWIKYEDQYDSYSLVIPPNWTRVTTAGAELQYRNILNVEQNLFVTLSSKSFSKFASLGEDFGTPLECAETWRQKYLGEFVSTRLGIKRDARVVAASKRTNSNDFDREFYDFLINIDSYAARNQYGISSSDRPQTKEWDRYFLTTVGIQGQQLFELRLQCNKEDYEKDREELLGILHSFELHATEFPEKQNALRGRKAGK